MSVGSRVRKILDGNIVSEHRQELLRNRRKITGMKMIDSGIVSAVVDEYLKSIAPTTLTLLDGFPCEVTQIEPFRQSTERNNVSVIGMITLELSNEIAISRQTSRTSTDGHPEYGVKLAQERVDAYENLVAPTIGQLALLYPAREIDSGQSYPDVIFSMKQTIRNLLPN